MLIIIVLLILLIMLNSLRRDKSNIQTGGVSNKFGHPMYLVLDGQDLDINRPCSYDPHQWLGTVLMPGQDDINLTTGTPSQGPDGANYCT